MKEEELKTEFDAKVRRGIFRPVARFLRNNPESEDRMQEGLASAWLTYRRLSNRGGPPDDALLVHHCRLRACDPARHLVSYGTRAKNHDPLAHNAFIKGKVAGVLRLDGLEEGLAREACCNPARKIISAMDLGAWLDGLPDDDKTMVHNRAQGADLGAIAAATGLNTTAVWRRLRILGEQLADRAGIRLPGLRPLALGGARS